MNKLFSLFNRVPRTLTRRRRWNSVDLFGVEHICDKHLRAFQANVFGARLPISVNNRAAIGILEFALLIKAPVLHLCAFFAPANLVPTSLAFYSAQATSKPRGGSSHQALSTRGISSMWRASSSPERRRPTSPNIILAPANVTNTRSGRSMVSEPAMLRHPASCSKRSLAWCDPRLNPRSSSGAVSMFWFVKRLKCQVTRGWRSSSWARSIGGVKSLPRSSSGASPRKCARFWKTYLRRNRSWAIPSPAKPAPTSSP